MSVKEFMHYIQMVDEHVITSTTDIHGVITSVSKAFCDISGYDEAELIGKSHNVVRHPDMPKSLYDDLWRTIKQGRSWSGEVKNLKKNGSAYWVKVNVRPNFDPRGMMTGFTAVRQDITDHKKIEQMMLLDELTQLNNRRHYNQSINHYIEKHHAKGCWIGYLMIDADNFKKYNDTYGHQAGDEVLIQIAQSLQAVFNDPNDQVFRLGGEEFCATYTASRSEALLHRADQARRHLQDKQIEHSGNLPFHCVTLSMGLMALDPQLDYAVEEVYKYADEALYQAKAAGRNQVQVVASQADDIELF